MNSPMTGDASLPQIRSPANEANADNVSQGYNILTQERNEFGIIGTNSFTNLSTVPQ